MKFKELKEKSPAELNRLLKAGREKLRDLRFRVASKQLKNVREVREEKKTLARIETLLKAKSEAEKKAKKDIRSPKKEIKEKQ